MAEENKSTYHIGSIGGNFNQSIQGGYTQIHGNQINANQDLTQAAAEIQKLLIQLESQGYSSSEARQQAASKWADEAKNNPQAMSRITKFRDYVRDTATSGLISEAAVEVMKMVLRLSGIPLP